MALAGASKSTKQATAMSELGGGPRPTFELGPSPQQRTCGDYCGMSEKCGGLTCLVRNDCFQRLEHELKPNLVVSADCEPALKYVAQDRSRWQRCHGIEGSMGP